MRDISLQWEWRPGCGLEDEAARTKQQSPVFAVSGVLWQMSAFLNGMDSSSRGHVSAFLHAVPDGGEAVAARRTKFSLSIQGAKGARTYSGCNLVDGLGWGWPRMVSHAGRSRGCMYRHEGREDTASAVVPCRWSLRAAVHGGRRQPCCSPAADWCHRALPWMSMWVFEGHWSQLRQRRQPWAATVHIPCSPAELKEKQLMVDGLINIKLEISELSVYDV